MLAVLALCVGVYGVYIHSQVKIQTDSLWSIPTAASLLHEGDTDLDEFQPTFAAYTLHGVRAHGGHAYYEYPLGAVLAATPFLAGAEALGSLPEPWLAPLGQRGTDLQSWRSAFKATGNIDLGFFNRTEQLIASFYVSAAVGVLFLALRRRVSDVAALGAVLLFAFGTTAYSTASRVLWQHGPSLLAVSCVVLLLTRPAQTARTAFLLGLAVACAYGCRPTNAVTVVVVTGFLALRWPRLLPAYLAGAAVVALPFCVYHLRTYGSLFSPYYAQGLSLADSQFFPALAANLVSPSRGLLVYSPFLLFSGLGAFQRWRAGELQGPERAFVAIVLLHWVAISAFPVWWAGHSIGPRFFTDVLPYLVYFLAFPLQTVLSAPRKHALLAGSLAVLAALSVFFHWRASTSFAVHAWNSTPSDVDRTPSRVWDWSDPQFLRAIPRRG